MTVRSIIEDFAKNGLRKYPDVSQRLKEEGRQIRAVPSPHDEIAAELAKFADHPCSEFTRTWISESRMISWIMAAQNHPSPKYLESLCKILECDANLIWHEGIVDILYDLKDERSISSLEKALTYNFSYDPTNELGVKVFDTLYHINIEKAREISKNYLKSSSPNLRRSANLIFRKG